MKKHDSMRGWFAYELYQQMKKNKNIILLTGDLGYLMFDAIRDELPDQFINCGAAEQAMVDIAVGLALEGKIPFCYSITTFLTWRPAEAIRLYVDHESIPVRLVGSGVKKSYLHDGISHWADDVPELLNIFKNIKQYWPDDKKEITKIVKEMIQSDKPSFVGLHR